MIGWIIGGVVVVVIVMAVAFIISTYSSIKIGSCGIRYSPNSSGLISITVAIRSNVVPLVENGTVSSIKL